MRVLVVYGSKRGGTAGLAEMVARTLRTDAVHVDLVPALAVPDLASYDAVIVGGSLYDGRWNADARRFVRRHIAELSRVPTWFFSSGPFDDSPTHRDIPPVHTVSSLMKEVGARGHVTFGGRLTPEADGFMAARLAKHHAGDWRDPVQVGAWAHQVAAELKDAHQPV
jgi:menaquinone-dependent protoporphyrinogen oxidase